MICSILRRPTGAAVVAWTALAGVSSTVHAQARGTVSKPEITALTIKGVKSVDKNELKQSIAIDESHCVSLVLKPFCLISKSPLFYRRAYLDRDELGRDMLRTRVFYYKRGFRDTQVDTTITPAGHSAVHVAMKVSEGPPTVVSRLDVTQLKPVLTQRRLRRRTALQVGQPLDLLTLDSTIVSLRNRLWDRGYSDAVIDTTIVLDSASHTAAVTLNVDPRWEAHIATISIQGNVNVSSRTIRKSLSLHPGDVYRQSDVLESQRALYESNLFQRASIDVAEGDDSLKHLLVAVQEAPARHITYSAGFNTVDFFQVQGQYNDYNWLGGAKRLTLDANVGNLLANQLNGNGIFYDVGRTVVGGSASQYLAPTYTGSAEVRYPWFGSPNNEAALSVFAHRRSAPGIYVDRGYGLSATFTRTVTPRGPLSLSYRYELTRVDAGDVYFCVDYGVCDAQTLTALRSNQRLSPIALTFALDKTDNPFEPRRGYRTQFNAEHASKFTISDFRYNLISGDFALFLPMHHRRVLAGHLRVGYVNALASTARAVGLDALPGAATDILHPRKRFYAGGANSVRGFGEAQLGPRVLTIPASKILANDSSAACQTDITQCNPDAAKFQDRDFQPRPVGGNEVVEASVEFRFPLFGSFTGATFVDGAFLSQNTDAALPKSKGAVTPGFGVRYASPVGPIRVDIGINPSTREKLPVVTEVVSGAAGTAGRLVTLRDRRTYAPAQSGSGINSVLSRLTLHLSIGEAF